MENLKVGMSFEVVEVLSNTFTDRTLFKLGGFTVGKSTLRNGMIKCMGNGSKRCISNWSKTFMGTCYLNMSIGREVKPIGRLTITSLK